MPGAPTDVFVHLLELRTVAQWALGAVGCLTAEEAERAHRLEDPRRRELFLVSRVALRHVLARRLGCAPAVVPVIRDPDGGAPLAVAGPGRTAGGAPLAGAAGGTPSEAGTQGTHGAQTPPRAPTFYSVARTPGFVAIALARRPVGVDVEALQSPAQAAALLRILHPEDRARVLRVPRRRRPGAVTAVWVRLEAVLKARGVGLTLGPDRVTVGRRRLPGGWRVTAVRVGRRTGVRLAVAWRAGDRGSQRDRPPAGPAG